MYDDIDYDDYDIELDDHNDRFCRDSRVILRELEDEQLAEFEEFDEPNDDLDDLDDYLF